MLFARLQLRAPRARILLVAPPRSTTDVSGLAQQLADAIGRAGHAVRLVDLRGQGDTDAPPGLTSIDRLREHLKSSEGFTIATGSSVLDQPAALLAAAVADGVIVVAVAGKTTRADLEEARHEIERAGGSLLGAVLQT
jgi:hypothetical protein